MEKNNSILESENQAQSRESCKVTEEAFINIQFSPPCQGFSGSKARSDQKARSLPQVKESQ